MQGSVFNNGWHYKELIVDYINQLNLKNKIIFNSNVNTDILGAASLLLPIKKYSD